MSKMEDESRGRRAFAPVLVLLAICALINYVDRGNLSIATPLLKGELRISVTQLGILLSGFFWTYTAMQFVSGWLVDRFDVNQVIAAVQDLRCAEEGTCWSDEDHSRDGS